jgi:hypothetical protein
VSVDNLPLRRIDHGVRDETSATARQILEREQYFDSLTERANWDVVNSVGHGRTVASRGCRKKVKIALPMSIKDKWVRM